MKLIFTKTETLHAPETGLCTSSKTIVERWEGVADVINDHTGGSMVKSSALSNDVGSENDKLIIIFKDTRPNFILNYRRESFSNKGGFLKVKNHFRLEPEPGEAMPEAIEVTGQYL